MRCDVDRLLTKTAAAQAAFGRARDLDTIPLRTDSRLNEIIRTVAESTAVKWIDGAQAMAGAARDGIPGAEFFYEHVHLTPEGNYALARFFADALVRRSEPLQRTKDARPPKVRLHRSTLSSIGASEGGQVKVKQGRGEAVLTAVVDPQVPPGVVRIAAAHASTCNLEGMTGPVSLEKV